MTTNDEIVLQEIEAAYCFYAQELKEMIDMVETHYDAVPEGMLSEIRCVTGHLCDATIRKDESQEKRLANVESAYTHLRRVYLDCYKLMCIYYRQYISSFDKKYFFIDWQNVTDGDFIRELSKLKKRASFDYKEAKKLERPGKNDRDENEDLGEVYTAYIRAFNSYCSVVDYIDENQERVDRSAHSDRRKKILSILGWIIGIAATIICTYVTIH